MIQKRGAAVILTTRSPIIHFRWTVADTLFLSSNAEKDIHARNADTSTIRFLDPRPIRGPSARSDGSAGTLSAHYKYIAAVVSCTHNLLSNDVHSAVSVRPFCSGYGRFASDLNRPVAKPNSVTAFRTLPRSINRISVQFMNHFHNKTTLRTLSGLTIYPLRLFSLFHL